MYKLLIIKRVIEDILMSPLILIGRIVAIIKPLKSEYDVFFFFPFYHIGGAEKVHTQITKAVGSQSCIIYFTKKSHNNLFLDDFKASGCVIKDISKFTDNKWIYFVNIIFRGILSGYINRQQSKPIVFNGQCNFGYKISPWVIKKIKQVELIHALNTFSSIRIPFLPFYSKSVTVSKDVIKKHASAYKRISVPKKHFEKFIFITSKIKLPRPVIYRNDLHEGPLSILYVGRDTTEKRPHIVSSISRILNNKKINILANFAGKVESQIPSIEKQYCNFYGEINDQNELRNIYLNNHILIIPSSTESGPLVFMEAMANGLAIISTPVGYIPDHIHNNKSGFVTKSLENEDAVIREMCSYIEVVNSNRNLLSNISSHNIKYAYDNFGQELFFREYAQLFSSLKN